jgi:hypothetical protein
MNDTLMAHDSAAGIRDLDEHYAELSDAARADEIRRSLVEAADARTRTAKAEIKKLAQYLTAQEACSLISALVSAFGQSLELRTSTAGATAVDRLIDAHATLEE